MRLIYSYETYAACSLAEIVQYLNQNQILPERIVSLTGSQDKWFLIFWKKEEERSEVEIDFPSE